MASIRVAGQARHIVVGAAGNLVLNVATLVSNLVIAVALARALGKSGYGVYAFATTWSIVLTVPAVLGLPPLVVRKVAEYSVTGEWDLVRGVHRRATQVVVGTSLAASLIAAIAALVIVRSNTELLHAFLFAFALVPIVGLLSVQQAVLTGLGRTVLGRVPGAIVSPLLFVFAVLAAVLLLTGLSAAWAVFLNAATSAAALVLSTLLLFRSLPPAARQLRPRYQSRSWLRSAAPLVVFSGLQILNTQVGVIVLGLFGNVENVGVYSVASRAAGLVTFLLITIRYSVAPTIARLYAQRDLQRLQEVVNRSAQGAFYLTLPLALGLFVFAEPILRIFFGEGFGAGTTALRILALGQLASVLTGLNGNVLLMTGNEAKMMKGSPIGSVTGLLLSLLLIPFWGILGAAIATSASVVLSNAILSLYAWRTIGIYTIAIRPRWLMSLRSR